jgi:hypothetical protein
LTAVADFLDDLYARDDSERAAAAEKLRLKEERKAEGRYAVAMTLGFARTSF